MKDSKGQDVKVGDRVYIFPPLHGDSLGTIKYIAYDVYMRTDCATVNLDSGIHCFLASHEITKILPMQLPTWKELHGATSISINFKRIEKPCQVCKRLNDVGVKRCWHCENIP